MPEQLNSLQASFWFMVLLQTIGSIDMPGRGPRKMPSPRNYAAIIIVWGTLQLLADVGMERAAKAIAWVVVLAGLTLGPFGAVLGNLVTSAANQFGTSSTQSTG